jgi:hypothetical protein
MKAEAIQTLKNSLPSIPSCTDLKKESVNSLCGPCKKCGGTDRFVYKTDSEKAFCRQCHPEIMDIIDFHAWMAGKTTAEFLKENFPRSEEKTFRESPRDQGPGNSGIQAEWDQILTHANEKPVFDLLKRRGLSDAVISTIYNDGLARFKKHAMAVSVGFPYKTLQGETLAVQYLTVDGTPFPFTVKNGKPANKVMAKGSEIGKDCYFICGARPENAKILFIAESILNVLTAMECLPGDDHCFLALGGSTFTNKVKALKPYMEHIEKVIVLVDHDDPSEKMLRAIWDILGMKVWAFRWFTDDPKGYDVNDLLMAGQRDRIIEMIQGAEQVRYAEDANTTEEPEPPQSCFKFTKLSALELKPANWLIREVCELDSLIEIFGSPEAGKSFVAVDMACCVATGTAFHGKKVEQGAVYYLPGEGLNGLKKRYVAWGIRHQKDLSDSPIFISNQPGSFSDTGESVRIITASIEQEGQPPVMIIVDTKSRSFGPGDENSTQDMGKFIHSMDTLRNKFKCTIALIHHSGHMDKGRGRGSTVSKGALDAEYKLEKDQSTGIIRLECTKMKDFQRPEPMAFKLRSVELGFVDDEGQPVTSAILDDIDYEPPPTCQGKSGRGKWQTTAMEILNSLYDDHRERLEARGYDPEQASVTMDDWRSECIKAGIQRQNWYRTKDSLIGTNKIKIVGVYVYVC